MDYKEDALKQELLALLKQNIRNGSFLEREIQAITELPDTGDLFFSRLLSSLIYVFFEEEEARKHWVGIIDDYRLLSSALRRDCGIYLAVLDYFTHIHSCLADPLLVENEFFRQTETLVMTDHLTKLFNRRYFNISLSKEMRRAVRYQNKLSVAMIDLDNFKQLNDTYGHPFGDIVLESFGGILDTNTRHEDIACRYGGEEFVILQPETGTSGALSLMARIQQNVKNTPLFAEKGITFSAGVACYPEHLTDENPNAIVLAADQALYHAKNTGKDRTCVYSPETNKRPCSEKNNFAIQYEIKTPLGFRQLHDCVTHGVFKISARLETSERIANNKIIYMTIIKQKGTPGEELCRIQARIKLEKHPGDGRFIYELKFYKLDQSQRAFIEQIV
ncbi:MAG: GGDEF domain-containing protein [Spirochaetota bacterium]|jgi:diguanylate cyclase (GGDEF)-like protein|nr:GGDEF domain-containing protein [Spirochaetota bacterium]